jgi:hypothetical protein
MHNVSIPTAAEEKGVIIGPVPIGENQEKTTETAPATLNGVIEFEYSLAAVFSISVQRFNTFSEIPHNAFHPIGALWCLASSAPRIQGLAGA